MTEDRKKYNSLEPVLHQINHEAVALKKHETDRNNIILNKVLTHIINYMREEDVLFKRLYSTLFYGGSFYDRLRVGKPEEFDLDLELRLPKMANPVVLDSSEPGFFHVRLTDLARFQKQPEYNVHYKQLPKLLDSSYLDAKLVLSWLESIVIKVLNTKPIRVDFGSLKITVHKSGPALTLRLRANFHEEFVKLDVDLVPCFIFTDSLWPKNGIRSNPIPQKNTFLVVPKSPGNLEDDYFSTYWRLSFQEQERVLLNNKQILKPVIKLLKLLRDKNFPAIKSYFIKTVLLNMLDTRTFDAWNISLSYAFMKALYALRDAIARRNIEYFWEKTYNLIGHLPPSALSNVQGRLNVIIKDIERNLNTNSYVLRKYMIPVSNQEFEHSNFSEDVSESTGCIIL